MLITFKSRAQYPDITMFGDVALALLKLMGRRETVPGTIQPAGIPAALHRLRQGLGARRDEVEAATTGADDEQEEPVSLHNRAAPLIELLQAALSEGVPVMWEEGGKAY